MRTEIVVKKVLLAVLLFSLCAWAICEKQAVNLKSGDFWILSTNKIHSMLNVLISSQNGGSR